MRPRLVEMLPLAVVLAACAPDERGWSSDRSPAPIDRPAEEARAEVEGAGRAFCERTTDLLCAGICRCCGHALEECTAAYRSACESTLGAAVDDGEVLVDDGALSSCLARLEVDLDDCALDRPAESCGDALVGARAPGEACHVDEACGTGGICQIDSSGSGTCAILSGLGESCAAAGCEPGLSCVRPSLRCEVVPASGEGCDPSSSGVPCGLEAYCDESSRICRTLGDAGDECSSDTHCHSDDCDLAESRCRAEALCG